MKKQLKNKGGGDWADDGRVGDLELEETSNCLNTAWATYSTAE